MATLTEFLKGIADALRTKKGTSDPIPAPNFAQEILGIQTGTDTSDATATSADILSGKTAYGQDGKITGTIPSKTESNISVSGSTVTVPAGHYAVRAQKSVPTVELATPEITVNTTGLVSASVVQPDGYITGGRSHSSYQIDTEVGRTVTPGASDIDIPTTSKFMIGNIKVSGDPNLKPENIKDGVSIFGVKGTFDGEDPIQMVFDQGTSIANSVYAKTISGLSPGDVVWFAIAIDAMFANQVDNMLVKVIMDRDVGTDKNIIIGCPQTTSGEEIGYLSITQNSNATSLTVYGTSSYGESYKLSSVRVRAISYMIM